MSTLRIHALVLTLAALSGWAAEAPDATAGRAPVAPVPNTMTADQEAAAVNAINEIRAKHDDLLATDKSTYAEVLAKRIAENEEWISRMRAFSGSNPDRAAATYELGGGLSIQGKWVTSPRHMRDTRFLGPQGQFDILDQGENILDDVNRNINKVANKIEKSKFACGAFDWVVQLKHNFTKAALQKYIEKLAETAIAAAPMALLANFSPTLYEIVKWLRLNAADLLNADKINCTNMENALTNVGQRMLRGEGYAECMKANQGLGVGEAHKICNAEKSPFDGLENTVGKVVGFAAEVKDLSITAMLGDTIRAPGPVELPKAQAAQSQALEYYNAAVTDAAKYPDPGEGPPVTATMAEKRAYTEAKENYEKAQANLKKATDDKNSAIAYTNKVGSGDGSLSAFWNTLRTGVADNLPNIIGDIRLSAKCDIQFGRQRQYQLMLKYKHSVGKLGLELTDRLSSHYSIISQIRPDVDTVAASYDALRSFCYGSMQSPWQQEQPNDVKDGSLAFFGDPTRKVGFGYDTLDKLATLWTLHQGSPDGSVERTIWPDKYRFIECINHIAAYEVYDYLYKKGTDDVGTIVEQMKNMGVAKQPGGERMPAQVEEALNEYLAMLLRKRNEQIRPLMDTIEAVNTFVVSRPGKPNENPYRSKPQVEKPAIQLGR